MFGKFFASAFTGSMVGAGLNVFAVWGYVIANTRADGHVEINPPVLAAILGCSRDDVESALAVLTAPDAHSRSKKEDGRRLIQKAAFCYFVPTYSDYREMRDENARREYMRDYMRDYRKQPVNSVNSDVSAREPGLAQAEAEAEAEGKDQKPVARSAKADTGAMEHEVMLHYTTLHPRRRPADKERTVIRRALKSGYSVADLCEAITGNAEDPWHKERGKHELTYVLRDNGLIDGFRDRASRPKTANGRTPPQQQAKYDTTGNGAVVKALTNGKAPLTEADYDGL